MNSGLLLLVATLAYESSATDQDAPICRTCIKPPIIYGSVTTYSFQREGDDGVLATLAIEGLPATDLVDIVGFSFTEAGDEVFALGIGSLVGVFDFWSGEANDNGAGLLVGTGAASAVSPPTPNDLANYLGYTGPNTFRIEFGTTGLGSIDYRYDTNDGGGQLRVNGSWVVVPEPSAMLYGGITSVLLCWQLAVRHRRPVVDACRQ